MSGLAGFAGYRGHDASRLLDLMSSAVRRSNGSFHRWEAGSLGVSVACHGDGSERQPVFNEDHSIGLVMNGEVFDFDRDRHRLMTSGHSFRFDMNSAEYCLHLYEEKGVSAFRDLNGMFAIVLFDLKKDIVLLVSDKFASYALYYSLTKDGALLFGSHLSSLSQSALIERELDLNAIFEYFSFAQVFTTRTFLKSVRMIEPASVLQYHQGTIVPTSYWQMRYKEEVQSKAFFVEKLSHVLKQAVSRRMRDNSRHGLLLSGGLDSRMLLAAANRPLSCFTFGDFDNREVRIARKLSTIKGAHHYFLKREPDHYANLIDEAVEIGDGMYCFTNAHGLGFFEAIQSECDVLWHGYAVERYFRGTYLHRTKFRFLGEPFLSLLSPMSSHHFTREMRNHYRTSLLRLNPSQLFQPRYARRLDGAIAEAIEGLFAEALPCCSNLHDAFLWLNTRYSREFAYLSVTSIRKYMRERSIALDKDMIDLHLTMPFHLRSNSEIWIKALRLIHPGIARVINANTGAAPASPEVTGWIMTMGTKLVNKLSNKREPLPYEAAHPTRAWPDFSLLLKFSPLMQAEMTRVISDPECLPPEIFNVNRIEEIYDEYMSGRHEYSIFLYLLLTLGKWHKQNA